MREQARPRERQRRGGPETSTSSASRPCPWRNPRRPFRIPRQRKHQAQLPAMVAGRVKAAMGFQRSPTMPRPSSSSSACKAPTHCSCLDPRLRERASRRRRDGGPPARRYRRGRSRTTSRARRRRCSRRAWRPSPASSSTSSMSCRSGSRGCRVGGRPEEGAGREGGNK